MAGELQTWNEKEASSAFDSGLAFDSWNPYVLRGKGYPPSPPPSERVGTDQREKYETGGRQSEAEGRGETVANR